MGVDPGTSSSAWVLFDGRAVLAHGIEENARLLHRLNDVGTPRWTAPPVDVVVFEQIESFGMAVGREVFETVFWTGRFFERASRRPVARLPRRAVKLHLCQSARAKDTNVRMALLDRFGGAAAAKGTSKARGPLYGISSHAWSALAVAVTWFDQDHSLSQQKGA